MPNHPNRKRHMLALTAGEARALLDAIGQMTPDNARKWPKAEWEALRRAEAKIAEAANMEVRRL